MPIVWHVKTQKCYDMPRVSWTCRTAFNRNVAPWTSAWTKFFWAAKYRSQCVTQRSLASEKIGTDTRCQFVSGPSPLPEPLITPYSLWLSQHWSPMLRNLLTRPIWFQRSHRRGSAVLQLFFLGRLLHPSAGSHAQTDVLGFRRRKNPGPPGSPPRRLHSRSPNFRKAPLVVTATSQVPP